MTGRVVMGSAGLMSLSWAGAWQATRRVEAKEARSRQKREERGSKENLRDRSGSLEVGRGVATEAGRG